MLDLKLPSGSKYVYTWETADGEVMFSGVSYERLAEASGLSQLKDKLHSGKRYVLVIRRSK